MCNVRLRLNGDCEREVAKQDADPADELLSDLVWSEVLLLLLLLLLSLVDMLSNGPFFNHKA